MSIFRLNAMADISYAWFLKAFGQDATKDIMQRCSRFLEEALELTQSLGLSREASHALVDYVHDREAGRPGQEAAGAEITLGILSNVVGINLDEETENELGRVWSNIPRIRDKENAKRIALNEAPSSKE